MSGRLLLTYPARRRKAGSFTQPFMG